MTVINNNLTHIWWFIGVIEMWFYQFSLVLGYTFGYLPYFSRLLMGIKLFVEIFWHKERIGPDVVSCKIMNAFLHTGRRIPYSLTVKLNCFNDTFLFALNFFEINANRNIFFRDLKSSSNIDKYLLLQQQSSMTLNTILVGLSVS